MATFRPATHADLHGIATVYAQAFLKVSGVESWILDQFDAALTSPEKALFVTCHNDRVIGFSEITLKVGATVAHLNNLHVLAAFQGRGIGLQLFQLAQRKAAGSGFTQLSFGPTKSAQPFYSAATTGQRVRKGKSLWSCDIA